MGTGFPQLQWQENLLWYVFSCRNGHNTNVPQDFSYLALCRNGVETRCTFCVTSYKMYSQPWRSNKFVSLCEVFSAFIPLINNGLYIFGAHTCFFCVLSVEKCVFVLIGSLHSLWLRGVRQKSDPRVRWIYTFHKMKNWAFSMFEPPFLLTYWWSFVRYLVPAKSLIERRCHGTSNLCCAWSPPNRWSNGSWC